ALIVREHTTCLVREALVRERLLEARDVPFAHDRRETPRELLARAQHLFFGERFGHEASLSVVSASARSSSVIPPASCVDQRTRALPHPSSTSGWWSFFAAASATRTTKPTAAEKSANVKVRAIAPAPTRSHPGCAASQVSTDGSGSLEGRVMAPSLPQNANRT